MNEYKQNTVLKIVCIFSFCLFMTTMFFQMHVANTTALKGKNFKELYDEKKEIEKEIAKLKYEESNLSSLSSIEIRAQQLGFNVMTDNILPIVPPTLASLTN